MAGAGILTNVYFRMMAGRRPPSGRRLLPAGRVTAPSLASRKMSLRFSERDSARLPPQAVRPCTGGKTRRYSGGTLAARFSGALCCAQETVPQSAQRCPPEVCQVLVPPSCPPRRFFSENCVCITFAGPVRSAAPFPIPPHAPSLHMPWVCASSGCPEPLLL